MVLFFCNNPFDACVDDHFCACVAGFHFAVECCAVKGDAESCGLGKCVLFCVCCADAVRAFVSFFVIDVCHQVSDVITVRKTAWAACVSCGEDAFVFDDDASGSSSCAGAAFADFFGDVHEVFVPVEAFAFFFYFGEHSIDAFVEGILY